MMGMESEIYEYFRHLVSKWHEALRKKNQEEIFRCEKALGEMDAYREDNEWKVKIPTSQ